MKNHYRTPMDYVIGLLTGKFQKRLNSEGKYVDEFVPSVRNDNRPLQELANFTKQSIDEVLVDLGLRQAMVSVDKSEFEKTPHERFLLKKYKKEYKERTRLTGPNWTKVGVFTF